MPEHRWVLERGDGDQHADGRRVHARLPTYFSVDTGNLRSSLDPSSPGTSAEIKEAMEDFWGAGVDILRLGLYLRPTVNHVSVERSLSLNEVERYRTWGIQCGIRDRVSGPLVRSSYGAECALAGNNVGLHRGLGS